MNITAKGKVLTVKMPKCNFLGQAKSSCFRNEPSQSKSSQCRKYVTITRGKRPTWPKNASLMYLIFGDEVSLMNIAALSIATLLIPRVVLVEERAGSAWRWGKRVRDPGTSAARYHAHRMSLKVLTNKQLLFWSLDSVASFIVCFIALLSIGIDKKY